jgi:hypothetical protein
VAVTQRLLLLKNQHIFWLTLGLFALVVINNVLNLFQASNAYFYQKLASFGETQHTNIVLITSKNLAENHSELIEKITEYNPKAVIVLSNQNITPSITNRVYYPITQSEYCVPRVEMWSSYHMRIPANDKESLCNSIWQTVFGYEGQQPRLIDFKLAVSALPKFSAERVLSSDVMSEQLKNKVIIVGQTSSAFNVNIHAPKLTGLNDPLLLMAYAADSIEKTTTVIELKPSYSALIELALVISLLFSFQKLAVIYSFVIALASCLFWVVVSYLGIVFAAVYIPVGQYIIVIFSTLFSALIVRKLSEDKALTGVVNNIQQKMMGRFFPQTFIEQASPWDPIIQLISQQLDLEKSIFLARKEDDHRIVEIRAINCELDNIQEMRRDYKRSPYSDALKALGIVKISRPFFKNVLNTEIEFMVPLVYAGDVRGFWALSVIPNETFDRHAFEKNVNKFAAQVAELLFHYHIYKTTQAKNQNLLNRLVSFKLHEPIDQQVKRSLNDMEQKLTTLELVFNHTRCATVLFNLFGQVVQTNAALEHFAKQHQLTIFEMTALDLLCHSCALDSEVAKGKLRYVTLNKADIHLPAVLNNQHYVLNIKAIHTDGSQTASGEPFQVSGILFEFLDTFENEPQLDDGFDETLSEQ